MLSASSLLATLALLTAAALSFAPTYSMAAANEHDHGSGASSSGAGAEGKSAVGGADKGAGSGHASRASSSHKGEMVSFQSGDHTTNGYLAAPRGKGPHPAVIVIHEWWGLNDQIRSVADAFAAKGYVALAPDLYHGKVTTDPSVAVELLKALSETVATSDLTAANSYLRGLPSVGSKPIGSIGFCMGGRLSLLLGLAEPKLSACVVCYGRPETETAKLAPLGAPLLAIYGGADKGIPLEMVDRFKKGAQEAGKTVDVRVYPGAPHGFMNPDNPGHSPRDTKEAWKVIDAFFAKNLGGTGAAAK